MHRHRRWLLSGADPAAGGSFITNALSIRYVRPFRGLSSPHSPLCGRENEKGAEEQKNESKKERQTE